LRNPPARRTLGDEAWDEERKIMRISAIQMAPGSDKAQNIAQARRLIDQAVAADRPDIVALPEIWTCLVGDRAAKVAADETLTRPGAPAQQDLGYCGGPCACWAGAGAGEHEDGAVGCFDGFALGLVEAG
jgi:predicted amidohydrolase